MTAPGTAARAAAAALALALAAPPAEAYVRSADPRTGRPLAWPVPLVPWNLNRDWPESAAICRATAAGDPALDAVLASFAQWEQSCTDLRLLYAGPSAELRTGGAASGENLVVFRRGWCSRNPAIVNQSTGAILDPCITDPDVDCGAIHGCFEDAAGCATDPSCADWGIVAQTSVLYVPTTGRILDADIELNGWDGVGRTGPTVNLSPPAHGWYFTCYPGAQPGTCTRYGQDGCAYIDLQNTATHEVGHFVGLRHPCTILDNGQPVDPDLPLCTDGAPAGTVAYGERTMNPTTRPGETDKRTLSVDDVAGVCTVYPSGSGGCGCGAAGGGGAAALLLGALALRPRRRRARG